MSDVSEQQVTCMFQREVPRLKMKTWCVSYLNSLTANYPKTLHPMISADSDGVQVIDPDSADPDSALV